MAETPPHRTTARETPAVVPSGEDAIAEIFGAPGERRKTGTTVGSANSGSFASNETSVKCLLIVACLGVFACNSTGGDVTPPSATQVTVTNENRPARPAPRRVSKADERAFFHLSQGSDFVPVCAIRRHQREQGNTGATAVADYFAQYGLIADPVSDEHNPLSLPIGVTLSEGRALAGFNCAACHVAKVPADASGQVIVGAPGRFDIRKFYDDTVPWLAAMLGDPKRRSKVVACVIGDSLRQALLPAHDKRAPEERDGANVLAGLDDGEKQAGRDIAELGSEAGLTEDSVGKLASRSASFQSLSPAKQGNVRHSLRHALQIQLRLLEARQRSLANVIRVGAIPHTPPGPGRVDAFMTAINLLQQDTELSMTSPVAYPPLWGTSTLKWLHYDGDTNAALQRNMGQSLGVGGVFVPNEKDPKKIDATTIEPENLVKLESVLPNMGAPRWPFGAIDEALVQRGKEVYSRLKCGGCHDPDKDGALPELPFGPLPTDQDPKTDSARLDNFERLVAGTPAVEFLGQRLDALAATAPAQLRDTAPDWRTTRRYAP
ncbi:MAG: hypothetical protein RL033_4974, partial [Pseudomonadota bacterium]